MAAMAPADAPALDPALMQSVSSAVTALVITLIPGIMAVIVSLGIRFVRAGIRLSLPRISASGAEDDRRGLMLRESCCDSRGGESDCGVPRALRTRHCRRGHRDRYYENDQEGERDEGNGFCFHHAHSCIASCIKLGGLVTLAGRQVIL